jgi:hypothetical protein
MKKLLALSMAATLLPSVLLAKGGSHTMSGCGLGYVLFGNSDNTQVMQILAATTNGTSGNQTFGITSGTSGCTQDGAVKFVKEAEVYAEINLKNIQQEMAAGGGEYLSGLASLLGVQEANRPEFFQMVKDNYSLLFPAADTTSVQMLDNLTQLLS